jgi:Binding-protein-dependent transport system inner membrane component
MAVAVLRQRHAGRIARELAIWPMSLKVGSTIVAMIVLAGQFAPLIAPYDPFYQDFASALQAPSLAHPFGTDMVGRDVFSRVLYGIRIDMQIGFFTTYVPMIYGVALGAAAGYFGGWFDAVIMRLLDIAMAFPFLVLIIVILSILGPGVQNIYNRRLSRCVDHVRPARPRSARSKRRGAGSAKSPRVILSTCATPKICRRRLGSAAQGNSGAGHGTDTGVGRSGRASGKSGSFSRSRAPPAHRDVR